MTTLCELAAKIESLEQRDLRSASLPETAEPAPSANSVHLGGGGQPAVNVPLGAASGGTATAAEPLTQLTSTPPPFYSGEILLAAPGTDALAGANGTAAFGLTSVGPAADAAHTTQEPVEKMIRNGWGADHVGFGDYLFGGGAGFRGIFSKYRI